LADAQSPVMIQVAAADETLSGNEELCDT
jgi:hypothetical protein